MIYSLYALLKVVSGISLYPIYSEVVQETFIYMIRHLKKQEGERARWRNSQYYHYQIWLTFKGGKKEEIYWAKLSLHG
ncbi:hypothetical protein LBSP_22190 [Lentilactobacillus buchneri subsp. silagei]|nr:hypothetical protein LBSP_22190 [Lentilactobacillus buchneri subsp. silagei]